MEKSVLEHLLSTYNWWMALSAIAVAVGIFGEYIVEFGFNPEARRNKVHLWVSLFFGAIVLAGVLGEYLFEKKVSRASETLQQLADLEVAHANAAAAEANLKAVRAQSEVARANANAAQARKQSAISLLSAKMAEEEASKNKLEAARLTKIAEEERAARLRLELTTAPRRLAPSDQNAMAQELRAVAGLQVPIFYRDQDTEPFQFASDIKQMLLKANFYPMTPQPEATILSDGPPSPATLRTGVWLTCTTVRGTFTAAQVIAGALAARGFEVHIETASSLSQFRNAPALTVSVEPRPVGAQGRSTGSQLSESAPPRSF
jgi:hypothetical protein